MDKMIHKMKSALSKLYQVRKEELDAMQDIGSAIETFYEALNGRNNGKEDH